MLKNADKSHTNSGVIEALCLQHRALSLLNGMPPGEQADKYAAIRALIPRTSCGDAAAASSCAADAPSTTHATDTSPASLALSRIYDDSHSAAQAALLAATAFVSSEPSYATFTLGARAPRRAVWDHAVYGHERPGSLRGVLGSAVDTALAPQFGPLATGTPEPYLEAGSRSGRAGGYVGAPRPRGAAGLANTAAARAAAFGVAAQAVRQSPAAAVRELTFAPALVYQVRACACLCATWLLLSFS